ncbi:uncharacterized protein LOC129289253 [Prosopis cineraria]|uniref:uncharacterized protein LOC129289253 n=1 Tax=Prosopis cineraria TaxID=364024 RepID=UPI00240FB7BD|nr:uncharacterized protein LOC129289253 [Prosopis cineraria]
MRQRKRKNKGKEKVEEVTIDHAFKRFARLSPPSFEGSMVDRAGEKWIDELEFIFSMMTCIIEQRVRLATFKLKDAAKQWWESVKPIDGSELTWEQFKKRFFAHYFPLTIRAAKEAEFYNLRQGNMNVEEFIAKFNELSKYFLYLRSNADEEWKCEQFLDKMRPEYRRQLAAHDIDSFEVMCNKFRAVARRS